VPARPAPIAFFAFNRPEHCRRTLAALAACTGAAQSELHVFVDGARDEAEGARVAEVQAIARAAEGFARVQVEAAPRNLGLYRSITGGVSKLLASHERVIVVEDDVLASPDFLQYMNDALERYAADERVACIHGFAPPLPDLPDYYFLRGGDCWGWATWADRWALFRPDAQALLAQMRASDLFEEFASSHGWGSLLMLARRALGRNQSWAILWHASLFLSGRFTLHPGRSFVRNIGVDGSGTHSGSRDLYASPLRETYPGLPGLDVREDAQSGRRLARFMDGVDGEGLAARLHQFARRTQALATARLALRRPAREPA
jgi:hypothetical protein